MSCGGHKDGSPNENSKRISEVAAYHNIDWDDTAYVFHGLTHDIRNEMLATEEGQELAKQKHPDTSESLLTIEVNKRARKLLDRAIESPELLPAEYERTHARIADLRERNRERTVDELQYEVERVSADPSSSPEDIAQAQADYYAALDSAATDAIIDSGINNLPDAKIENGILQIGDGTAGATGISEESIQIDNLVQNIKNDGSSTDSLTIAEQVEAAVIARNTLTESKAALEPMAADVLQRIDNARIKTVIDSNTGVTLNPMGGVRYSGWKHDEISEAIGREIADRRGLPEADVQKAINGYRNYAGIDYYRGPALRELGIRARDYAKVNPEPRRAVIKFPDRDDSLISEGVANGILQNRAELEAMPDRIAELSERVKDMPLDQAVRELAATEHSLRSLKRVTDIAESSAYDRLSRDGVDEVETSFGKYTPYSTKPSDKWDPEIDRALIKQVSEDTGVDPAVTGVAVRDYLNVGHAGRYKVRSLKQTSIDPDDYRSQGFPTHKIKIKSEEPEEN